VNGGALNFDFAKCDRFVGDFEFVVVGAYQATALEQAYLERVNRLLGRLAAADVSNPEMHDELERTRRECADNLLQRARRFAKEQAGQGRDQMAVREMEASHRIEGVYLDRRDRVLLIPFVVSTVPAEPERPIRDIEIRTRDTPISEEKRRFKVEIDRSITVIKTVLGERRSRWWWAWRRKNPDPMVEDARNRLDEYLFGVAGIAKVGLMNMDKTQTPFAQLALEGLQNEFVSREAGIVKNSYVARLGLAATVAVFLGVCGYIASGAVPETWIPYRFREFFLLACGSAVGTWLSFSIRRVQLNFSDLATLEEDRLNPSLRIIFMIALTSVVGLLLWTHAVVIEIGGFKSAFAHNGVFALLIGALSGIAERAMTTAVSKRAQDFAASLGGSGKAL
jgi:hypothetical protein